MALKVTAAQDVDLRQRRVQAGLSQQRVAELADCSIASIRLFEQGYSPKHSEVLERLRKVLDDERRSAPSAAVQESRRQARHGEH